MKKHLMILMSLFTTTSLFSQVGINTEIPQGMLHVDGKKDNQSPPTTEQAGNDFVVTTNGNAGVGTITPAVKLDLRSTSNLNNALGIGSTSKTAEAVGAGTIRYVDVSGGKLQVSDGVQWMDIYSTPKKSFVVARIRTADKAIKFTYNIASVLANWEVTNDVSGSFNGTSGEFTAPRDGVYTFSFAYDFVQEGSTFLANSSVESQFVKNNNLIEVKCLKTYGKSTRGAQAGGNCVSSMKLNENDKVVVRLLQRIDNSTSGGRGLRSSPTVNAPNFGFNNLTIVEQ
ncbi:MAG: C1q-like domain-containing protein [Empedobacter falsenii]